MNCSNDLERRLDALAVDLKQLSYRVDYLEDLMVPANDASLRSRIADLEDSMKLIFRPLLRHKQD